MMKTQEPSTFNFSTYSYDDENDTKKSKLTYTSDFLKSFNKGKSESNEKEQVEQLTNIIHKLTDIITEHKDEALVKKMSDVLNSNEAGRSILNPTSAKKTVSLVLPAEMTAEGFDHTVPISPTSLSMESSGSYLFNKQSPRGIPSSSSSITVSPSNSSSSLLSSSPTSVAPSAQRPPLQRQSSAGKLPLGQTSTPSTLAQPSSTSSSSSATPSNGGSYVPPSQRVMKRSPSMPSINNEQKQQMLPLQPTDLSTGSSLKQMKKSPSLVVISDSKKVEEKKLAPSSSSLTAAAGKTDSSTSSRPKGIKKSVSMSSISMDDKNNGALKCTSLEEIVGQIYPLTKYQAGCRFLQKKLEEQPDPVHVSLVFNEVYEHLVELMTDPYGQYLVPKLMFYCDKAQRQAIVTKIAPKIASFACHTYGIHGVQKILEYLTDDQVDTFVEVIKPTVISLGKDAKGNYLLQSFLKQFTPEKNQYIFDAVTANIVDVCTHKVGCTLVNKCIDHANPVQLAAIMESVAKNCLPLVQDQFGNYVVQHILDNKSSFAPIISKSMLGHIPMLCVQKFSSNVIEKCLQVSVNKNPELYDAIMKEVTDANLLELLQDKYANFVIQTALDVANDEQHAHLVKMILPYIHQIKTPYVMHIQKKILQV